MMIIISWKMMTIVRMSKDNISKMIIVTNISLIITIAKIAKILTLKGVILDFITDSTTHWEWNALRDTYDMAQAMTVQWLFLVC